MLHEDTKIHLKSFVDSGLILASNSDITSSTFSLNYDYKKYDFKKKYIITS